MSRTALVRPALSPRQTVVLGAICTAIDDSGRSPTIREIAEALDIASTNAVNDHLGALAKKGWLDLGPDGESRALRPLYYPDGSPFLTRRELLEQLAEARVDLDDARTSADHAMAINDGNLCAYERVVHGLDVERQEAAEALAQCRAHCRSYYQEARTLRGQVSTLQAELGVGRLTLPRAVVTAIQSGHLAPVLDAFGLGDCREVA